MRGPIGPLLLTSPRYPAGTLRRGGPWMVMMSLLMVVAKGVITTLVLSFVKRERVEMPE